MGLKIIYTNLKSPLTNRLFVDFIKCQTLLAQLTSEYTHFISKSILRGQSLSFANFLANINIIKCNHHGTWVEKQSIQCLMTNISMLLKILITSLITVHFSVNGSYPTPNFLLNLF